LCDCDDFDKVNYSVGNYDKKYDLFKIIDENNNRLCYLQKNKIKGKVKGWFSAF